LDSGSIRSVSEEPRLTLAFSLFVLQCVNMELLSFPFCISSKTCLGDNDSALSKTSRPIDLLSQFPNCLCTHFLFCIFSFNRKVTTTLASKTVYFSALEADSFLVYLEPFAT